MLDRTIQRLHVHQKMNQYPKRQREGYSAAGPQWATLLRKKKKKKTK